MRVIEEIEKRIFFVRPVLRHLIIGVQCEILVELPVQLDICAYLCIRRFGASSEIIPRLVQNLSAFKHDPQPGEPKPKPPSGLKSVKSTCCDFSADEIKEIDIGTVQE